MQPDASLKPGDRIPNFLLPDQENARRSFYHELLGQPILLLAGQELNAGAVLALAQRAEEIAELKAQIFCVTSSDVIKTAGLMRQMPASFTVFSDPPGQMVGPLMASAGAGGQGRLFLLDQNQRIMEIVEIGSEGCDLTAALSRLKEIRDERASSPSTQGRAAPVLLLPHLFDQAFCRQLIDLWKAEHQEGGFSTGYGNTYDASRKKTLEHVIKDPALHRYISYTLARRVGPELAKVFNYQAAFQFEVHIVMSYLPDRQDFFGLHRDDLRPENKRRFALSLNLNDDFEGGELHFPEYSPDGYKMAAGMGCIFSCPLLHEARPVTKGQRFVMTSFFCDSDQAAGDVGVKQRSVRL
jgi:peroxiredoxin